jgi:hypothetical protein
VVLLVLIFEDFPVALKIFFCIGVFQADFLSHWWFNRLKA